MRFRRSLLAPAMAAVVTCCIVGQLARASIVPPGGTAAPDPLTLAGTAVLATYSDVYATPDGSMGSYITSVLSDPGNPLGGLDFIYQFTATAGPNLTRAVGFSFRNYITDVGYDATALLDAPPGYVPPPAGALLPFPLIAMPLVALLASISSALEDWACLPPVRPPRFS
jgi:hypothetical protein